MSERIPKVFYNNLSCFVQLLDNEAYHLRNAVVDIMKNVIEQVISKQAGRGNGRDHRAAGEEEEDDSESHEKAREKILDALLQRVYDKHAFCRSHVLGTLVDLCTANLVPQTYLSQLLESACDRIKDTSANVRRKAIQLLQKVVEYYSIVFVKSQNRTKFLTDEEIEREASFNSAEKQELLMEVRTIEVSLADK